MSMGQEWLDDHAYEIERSHRETPPHKLFTRGYDESRKRLASNPYYSRSCFNCAYYYQASGDKEEVCQNNDVIEYDMVVEANNVYCVRWTQNKSATTHTMFKKTGRSRLD